MAHPSRKKLAEALIEMGRLPADFDPARFDNEVFGREAYVFLNLATSELDRLALETRLEARGFKVDRKYWPGSTRIQVRVAYFKGWHWDE